MNQKRVVITGLGPICSAGIGKEQLWDNLLKGITNLQKEEVYVNGELWERFYKHKIAQFDFEKFGIDKERLSVISGWKENDVDIDFNYLIASIKLAEDDSEFKRSDKDRLGIIIGHENLGLMEFGEKVSHLAYDTLINKKNNELSKRDFLDGFFKKFLKKGYDVQAFANLFHVTQLFDIHDYSLFINNACASGLYAIEAASDLINSGKCDVVYVAASDYCQPYKYIWFRDIGYYSDEGLIKPFCRDSKGIVCGDGSATIIMESFEHAHKRGARIYAEYLGGGFHLEGWRITMPKIGSNSYQRAIKQSFERSDVRPEDINMIVPHGIGSKVADAYEAKAITDIFGKFPKQNITAFKPYVGHTLGLSSLLETVIMLLCLERETALKTINCQNPDDKLKIKLIEKTEKREINYAMKICCAFAGYNASSIFRRIKA